MQKKYFGGELELDPVLLIKSKDAGYQSCLEHYLLYSSGRAALRALIQALTDINHILIPAYLCESILAVFKEMQVPYLYYKLKHDMYVDEADLLEKLKGSSANYIYSIDLCGIVSNVSELVEEIKKLSPGVKIIQDISHLSFIPQVVSNYHYYGDFVYGSLRKVLPVPDGAVLLKNKFLGYGFCKQEHLVFTDYKLIGKTLKWFYLNSDHEDSDYYEYIYLSYMSKAELLLNDNESILCMTDLSMTVLNNLDFRDVFVSRQRNYNTLREILIKDNSLKGLIELPAKLNHNDMPYMFPVRLRKPGLRDTVKSMLKQWHIFSATIWDIPKDIDRELFPESYIISENTLFLPIDQRYKDNDIGFIAQKTIDVIKDLN